jgi:hypothetical protein
MLRIMLDNAVQLTGADMVNIQLLDPHSEALRITAERGFRNPFLEFFACVREGRPHAAPLSGTAAAL